METPPKGKEKALNPQIRTRPLRLINNTIHLRFFSATFHTNPIISQKSDIFTSPLLKRNGTSDGMIPQRGANGRWFHLLLSLLRFIDLTFT